MRVSATVPVDLAVLPLDARITLIGCSRSVVLVRGGGLKELPALSDVGERLQGMKAWLDGVPVKNPVVPRHILPNRTFTIAAPDLSPVDTFPQSLIIEELGYDNRLDMGLLAPGHIVTITTTNGIRATMCLTTDSECAPSGGSITEMMAPHPDEGTDRSPINWVAPRVLVPGLQLAIGGKTVGIIQSYKA